MKIYTYLLFIVILKFIQIDPEQPYCRDARLGRVANRSGQTHCCTVTTSSRGLKGGHSTSDVPTTPSNGIYHGFNAPRSSVYPHLFPLGYGYCMTHIHPY